MRLGISSYTFPWAVGVPGYPALSKPMTAEVLLEEAAEMGVSVVQIADNLPLDQLSHPELDALARRARDLHIDIEVGARGCSPKHLRAYIRLAESLESTILRTVLDSDDDKPPVDEVVARLATIAPELERAGVNLAVENHDRFRARSLIDILNRVGSERVGICLDTANSFGRLEGPDAVLETLGTRVLNLHIKDFAVRRLPHKMGFTIEGRAAGAGQLDIPSLLAKLRGMGSDPNAVLEQWPPAETTTGATVEKERRWARSGIHYLRQFILE